MSIAPDALSNLHRIHLRLRSVQDELKRGPKQVSARKQHTQRKEAELQDKKQQLKQLKMTADQKSLQLKTNESKIADLKSKLNTASSNREYDVIRSQIEADSMANSVLEDEVLEVYEKIDRVGEEIAACEQDVSKAKSEEERVAEQVAAREPKLREEANRLESELAEAERQLPASVMDRYHRLVQAYGADALASVESDSCTACYSILSPNERVELNMGKILFCRSCGRILYKAAEK